MSERHLAKMGLTVCKIAFSEVDGWAKGADKR